MVLSIDMLRDPSIQSKNYSRTKDLAWKLTTGLMAAFFYTAAVLQVNSHDSLSSINYGYVSKSNYHRLGAMASTSFCVKS